MNILAHTCFIGTTGYANHARSFFTALNKYHTIKVRNDTVGKAWSGYNKTPHDKESYLTNEMKMMLFSQTLLNNDNTRSDFPIYSYSDDFKPDVHIVLSEMNSQYFYENYDGYKIAYNVWESTRYPDIFFQRLLYFDEVWVPSKWQKDNLIDQGYPQHKIFIVPEGVDHEVFKPIEKLPNKKRFRFLLFGRWEYRKATTEIIRAFGETFKGLEDKVELICSVENPYPYDGFTTTNQRVKHNKLDYKNVRYIEFPSRKEYIKYLQEGDIFVSCSRSEGWFLPLIESMSCGTPSIYSDWGAQLEYAQHKGIPVNIIGLTPANFEHKDWPGDYCEPDFNDLSKKMLLVYENYGAYKAEAIEESKIIRDNFNWDAAAQKASSILTKTNKKNFAFVTTGDIGYMPVIEQLVYSLLEFSKADVLVYGVNCEVPFSYSNVIKRTITPPTHSKHDKWYWKQHACIEATKENYDFLIWIDGDVVVNYNIDNIQKYFNQIVNYPLSDIHVQEDFFGFYNYKNNKYSQRFDEELTKKFNIERHYPILHVCMYIFDKRSNWFFEELLKLYYETPLEEYEKLFLWNDEGIHNFLCYKYKFKNHLPLSNFDTSGYDGDTGQSDEIMQHFYCFWNESGPKNFNKIYGYQYIPENKENILYFHGNKNKNYSHEMIEYIKNIRDNNFYETKKFFTSEYVLDDCSDIFEMQGSTLFIAEKYGWAKAIFHEIYNLRDYYYNREKRIFDGDIVVDLGGNIGIFNRWAYSEGASKVISFEPDKRYFRLLSLNADPRSILFNSAISDKMGEIELYESSHLGGSTVIKPTNYDVKYKTKTYTLDYLFETNLIDRIDFLKIDIEGAEINALNGISDKNLSKVKTISIEYHHAHLNFDIELRDKTIKRLNLLGFNSYLLFLGNNDYLQMLYFWR